MPLRQSVLSFKGALPSAALTTPPAVEQPASSAMPSPPLEEVDTDTIVVNVQPIAGYRQLPTPSESVTDVSSQCSVASSHKNVPRSRSKRVSNAISNDSMKTLVKTSGSHVAEDKSRSISGETLIPRSGADETFPTHKDATDSGIPWDSKSALAKSSHCDMVESDTEEADSESTITVNDQGARAREEQQAMKKAKMLENAKAWEERNKAAEEKATRRSSRASMLMTKAGDMVSELATNVLGKRNRAVTEGTLHAEEPKSGGRLRPTSAIVESSNIVQGQNDSKKRRLSEESVIHIIPSTKIKLPKDKRWLTSGLYTGQNRAFNPLLTESKNKRKSFAKESQAMDNQFMPLPMFAGERLLKQGRDFKLPFDVFSPLPAGQPKPDEWKKVNKNVFVGDAAAEWRTSKFDEHSTCLCTAQDGCDHNCMNRYMYYECDERNCNLTEEQCRNRAFEGLKQRVKKGGRYNVGVEVIKTDDRGYGVRSNRTFEPNQIIVEYTGEIITQEECEARMRTMYKDNECYYLMLFDQNMIIDATRGSMARFVNHSCEPNCRMEKWTVGGKPRMALFAGDSGIMTGEELTYDYNFDPYSQKNVQECRCGAKNCRGILGPKTKEDRKRASDTPDEDKSNKKEGKLANAKRKIAEVLEESTNRLNKKRKTAAPQAVVYTSPLKKTVTAKLPKNVRVTQLHTRKVSFKTPVSIVRQPSKIRRILTGAKIKSTGNEKRVISASSVGSTKPLIPTGSPKDKPLSRSGSLRERAGTMTKNVVRSMRGR